MARTAEQQREYNRVRRAQWRANAKAKKTPGVAPIAGTVATPGAVEEPALIVDVKTEDTPKPSLKERILAKLQDPTPVPGTKIVKKARKQENLLSSTLPTVVCSFVATYSQQLIADPYKPCAPSQQEVTGMLGPLMDILARQVEITGKASQTTIDVMNSLICSMMYGIRAYVTYVEIKKMEVPQNYAEEKARKQADQRAAYREKRDREAREYDAAIAEYKATSPNWAAVHGNDEPSLAGGLRAYKDAANRPGGHNDSQYAAATNAAPAETYDASGGTDIANGATEGRDYEAAQVDNLFKRDVDGRIRLGLLAPRIRTED
jgi:hypothetical protein